MYQPAIYHLRDDGEFEIVDQGDSKKVCFDLILFDFVSCIGIT